MVEATKTTYVLGSGYAPDPPPLLRYTTPVNQTVPVRRRLRQTAAMLHFNHQTGGALQTSTEELTDLKALMDRVQPVAL